MNNIKQPCKICSSSRYFNGVSSNFLFPCTVFGITLHLSTVCWLKTGSNVTLEKNFEQHFITDLLYYYLKREIYVRLTVYHMGKS